MSDDLVKRLRLANAYKGPDFSTPFVEPVKQEAANRIEELEAKLAKATKALEAIARPKTGPDTDWTKPEIYKWRAGWYLRHEERARTTLAELRGDKKS